MSKSVSAVGIGSKVKYNKHLCLGGIEYIHGRGLGVEWAYFQFDGFCEVGDPGFFPRG